MSSLAGQELAFQKRLPCAIVITSKRIQRTHGLKAWQISNNQLTRHVAAKKTTLDAKRYRISTHALTKPWGAREWASGQRTVLKRWYCRLGEKILSTHRIRRMDSRWHLSSRCKTSHTKPMPLQITTATNFQKAPPEKAPTTSISSRCPSTVAMHSKIIMCRTASV